MTATHFDSQYIQRLLAEKHARDIAVVECPLEPYGALRADLWVMRPSWTKPMVTIYEVKVSRQDFLRDDKWRNYLPYCNAFYFAVAPGVVDKREIPEGVGLLELSKTGSMMRTVLRAHPRDDDHKALAQVTKAVLMNRVWGRGTLQIAAPLPISRDERIAAWRKTAEDAESVGRIMSKRIRKELAEAENRARAAESRVAAYTEFEQVLRGRGIRPCADTWNMERQLDLIMRDTLETRLLAAAGSIKEALVALAKNPSEVPL